MPWKEEPESTTVHGVSKSWTQLSTIVLLYNLLNGGFPDGSSKNLPASVGDAGDMGSIPGPGRYPVEGDDNPLQYPYGL